MAFRIAVNVTWVLGERLVVQLGGFEMGNHAIVLCVHGRIHGEMMFNRVDKGRRGEVLKLSSLEMY